MPRDWTIDTWVLYRAGGYDMPALELLHRILRKNNYLLLDHEENIEKEYRKCFNFYRNVSPQACKALEKWFADIISKAVKYFSGILEDRHERALTKRRFDRDDWAFVAVCARGNDKILVSEESDYSPEVCEYLKTNMGVSVIAIIAALEVSDT